MTNLDKEIIINWDQFPDSFHEKYEEQILKTDVQDDGVVVTIIYDYAPYCPGRYDGPPDKCYPVEGPDVELCATIITVYPQRAATGYNGQRLYEVPRLMPSGIMKACLVESHDHLNVFDDDFLEAATTYASEWLDENDELVMEILHEDGAKQVRNEIDEILIETNREIVENGGE
jgi:hypothetical protein